MGSMFRKLKASEIDARVATVTDNGVSLLLYKDARVDQTILDETVGPYNWKRDHELIGDRLYCTVSIRDPESGEWISKQDVGTESRTEKEKGQASDSFKRACFNWGIGRELYTAPRIWINAGDCEIKGRACYDRFVVTKIAYKNDQISGLQIMNRNKRRVVYEYGDPDGEPDPAATKRPAARKGEKEKARKALTDYAESHELKISDVAGRFKLNKNSTASQLTSALETLRAEGGQE